MHQLKQLYRKVLSEGVDRDTRTGVVRSLWDEKLVFDLRQGFPAVTSKKLPWQACVGELLFFLSGTSSIRDLKHYTFNDPNSDKWTIWTDDAVRWNEQMRLIYPYWDDNGYSNDDVGELYPTQWRDFNVADVDQIANLIRKLNNNPESRDMIVMAWNPEAIQEERMALKPCHLGFQCYVTQDGHLNLKFWQRSVDCFLGLPINISSYSLLNHLLANWTGLKPGKVTADLGDVHIYHNHYDAVQEYLNNPVHDLPRLELPTGCNSLESTLKLTALDFKQSLVQYTNQGVIKAPLSVGN